MKKIGFIAGSIAIASALFIAGCSSNDDSKKVSVQVVAKGLGSLSASQVSKILVQSASVGTNSVSIPDENSGEYEGMGVATSRAKIDSFKILLRTVTFGTVPGPGGKFISIDINQELDISEGVNAEVSGTGSLDPDTYSVVALGFAPRFKIKAYAYFDVDNDGEVDTTVYTTASGIKKVPNKVDMSAASDYAEYEYKFLYVYCSSDANGSVEPTNCGNHSILPEPVTVSEGSSPKITVMITSLNTVAAWTGLGNPDGYGTHIYKYSELDTMLGYGTKLAPIGFPADNNCSSQGQNPWGKNDCDFFPIGQPAFRVNYLPAFAFLDASDLSYQTYVISTRNDMYNHYNTSSLTIVVKNGTPLLGMLSTFGDPLVNGPRPVVGTAARLFESEGGGKYTFYMDYRATDDNGNEDGGLYYNNDKNMAGYIANGFKLLDAVGDSDSFTVKDGPRCSGEYNYCFAQAKRVGVDPVDPAEVPGYDEETGERTYYYKRVK